MPDPALAWQSYSRFGLVPAPIWFPHRNITSTRDVFTIYLPTYIRLWPWELSLCCGVAVDAAWIYCDMGGERERERERGIGIGIGIYRYM